MASIHCRGIDIGFAGEPGQAVADVILPRNIALLGDDYPGLRPRFAVAEGDAVGAGDLLFTDRRRPELRHVAPAGGIVVEIRCGGRRSLDRLVIALDGREGRRFEVPAPLDRPSLTKLLVESGAWQALKTRPFDDTPVPGSAPEALFVTAIDTRPLAPDSAVVIDRHRDWFAAGLGALPLLANGPVHLCHAAKASVPTVEGVKPAAFSGPHPAGLAGTHIQYLHPVGHGGTVWHIGYQDVIAIGHLLTTGRIWTRRVVALAGDGVRKPCLIETVPGAELRAVCADELIGAPVRLLSGSPLDGRPEHHLARGHIQVTATTQPETGLSASGFAARLRAWLTMGGTAIIPNAAHEPAAPPGILPIPFLRAISVGDSETARRLGALAFGADDMALLSYVDGGRTDFGALLLRTLDDLRETS